MYWWYDTKKQKKNFDEGDWEVLEQRQLCAYSKMLEKQNHDLCEKLHSKWATKTAELVEAAKASCRQEISKLQVTIENKNQVILELQSRLQDLRRNTNKGGRAG